MHGDICWRLVSATEMARRVFRAVKWCKRDGLEINYSAHAHHKKAHAHQTWLNDVF